MLRKLIVLCGLLLNCMLFLTFCTPIQAPQIIPAEPLDPLEPAKPAETSELVETAESLEHKAVTPDEIVSLVEWLSFVEEINKLSHEELLARYEDAIKRLKNHSDDRIKIDLSFILSRPNTSIYNIEKSRALLSEINGDSVYAPLRDLMLREIIQIAEFQAANSQLKELHTQLEMLKKIDGDITESQKEIEEVAQ